MSKYQFQQSDIYQPGTDLPINLLNVSDGDVLHAIEAQLLHQAYQTFTGHGHQRSLLHGWLTTKAS